MLISTDLPNDDERSAALAAVPWRGSVRCLSTEVQAAYVKGALDLIDASIGPDNHYRAALVALFDGANTLRTNSVLLKPRPNPINQEASALAIGPTQGRQPATPPQVRPG
jgi:hypothetical protein